MYTTQPQGAGQGAGAGSMHTKYKNPQPGKSFIQVLCNTTTGAHANRSIVQKDPDPMVRLRDRHLNRFVM